MPATDASIGRLYAGASGFSYPSWKGGFYPEQAKPQEFLRYYAQRLPAVELNTTGYRLPPESRFEAWAAETPPKFRFAVKMNRRIAHGGDVSMVADFCRSVRSLGTQLGPILVQFAENRPRDDGFLRLFLDSLLSELDYAFELRHPSWDVDEALAEAGVVRVGSLGGSTRFRYLRLREPPYDERSLGRLAERVVPVLRRGIDVYCFFKHEPEPTAPLYAEQLLRLASERTPKH